MDLVSLQNEVAVNLAGKSSLNGVVCLTIDRLDIINEVDRALATLGLAAIVGTSNGSNPQPNALSAVFNTVVGVRVLENVVINRGRVLSATVANRAARLALVGTPIGSLVAQTDVSTGQFTVVFKNQVSALFDVAVDATAATLQSILNAIPFISDSGGVVVTGGLVAGYTITWNLNGPQPLFKIFPGRVMPLGGWVQIVEAQAGVTGSLPEIQTLTFRQFFWLVEGSGSSAGDWGYWMTATQVMQLVVRSCHMFFPTSYQTMVVQDYDYGSDDSVVDIVTRFATRILLPNDPVT